MLRKIGLPALVAGAVLTLFSASPASAQRRDGGNGGRSYSGGGGRSYSGGARSYGGGSYNGGRAYSGGGGRSYGGNFREGNRGYSGGRDWDRGRSYGGGARFYYGYPRSYGFYSPGYACDPAGYYDQWGGFHYYPGCAAYPY